MLFEDKVVSSKLITYTSLAVFVLALWPRVWGLGGFLTTDERFWVESSRDFLGGLLDEDFTCPAKTAQKGQLQLAANRGFGCTIRAGHPGVITMWSGSLGLWFYYLATSEDQTLLEFIRVLPVKPVEQGVIPWVRLPTAVLAAGGVTAMFLLLTRLFKTQGEQGYFIALLAAGLAALDPYEIALSRILHTDALETIFLTLSVLAAFYYWGYQASRRWLLLSGGLAGLSFLAKSPALFLAPLTGLLGVWYLGRRVVDGERLSSRLIFEMMLAGLIWTVAAALVYGLLWPALWVIPAVVWDYVFRVVLGYASELDDKGTFFWGRFVLDPGPYFYPVSWLSRATLLAVPGVLLAGWFWLRRGMTEPDANIRSRATWLRWLGYGLDQKPLDRLLFLTLVFVITFVTFLTFSQTKEDRYLLPIYPFLNLVAAIGWVGLLERLPVTYRRLQERFLVAGFVALALGLSAWLAVLSFPYYFTYYNPLLGGLPVAQRIVPVGWGEGLDLAAAYLNQRPDAANLKVASWYGDSSFAPFFVGQTLDYYQQKGNVLAGDYVIVYIHQLQRQLPDAELYSFLNKYAQPEKIIEVGGIPYVWIYPGVGLDHHLEYDRYPDLAELLGWEYTTPGVDPDHPVLQPGRSLDFELWWEYLGKSLNEPFFMWLVGHDHRIWAEATTQPKPETGDLADWARGKIMTETGRLVIPPGTPPGDYTVYLGFYPVLPASPTTALLFSLNDTSRIVTIERGPQDGSMPAQLEPLHVEVGPLSLLGQHVHQTDMKPDEAFDLDLYWQVSADLTRRYQVSLALLDETGVERWAWERVDPVSFYPTQNWRQGDLIRSQLTARPTWRTPGGKYQLTLNVYEQENLLKTVPLLPVSIQGRVRQFTLPAGVTRVETSFEHGINLLAYQILEPVIFQPGAEVKLQLFWQTQADLAEDYTVFVQLLGPDGKIHGQMDAQPQNGAAPTSQWTPGEVVWDSFTFSIAAATPPGDYQLITGLYQVETSERLALRQTDQNFLKLIKIQVK